MMPHQQRALHRIGVDGHAVQAALLLRCGTLGTAREVMEQCGGGDGLVEQALQWRGHGELLQQKPGRVTTPVIVGPTCRSARGSHSSVVACTAAGPACTATRLSPLQEKRSPTRAGQRQSLLLRSQQDFRASQSARGEDHLAGAHVDRRVALAQRLAGEDSS
jgi:hypothetical protein